MKLDQILDNILPIPETSKRLLQDCIEEKSYSKGHILLRADKIETTIYFIKKGIARAYSNQNDNEATFWFGKEGDTILSMKSYVVYQKGYEDVELLED
ncbi:MAG: Crp/Fnr family transcriptional regulator, partial [Flavobacterium sp.]